MPRLIECVPNFSEGRDRAVIDAITSRIETVDGVALLDVDPGRATNRTVVTFVGTPDEVVEAAVRAVATATELIDMRTHSGEHPRFGATDVCPLVPVAGVSMEETVEYAQLLARRLADEVGLSIYCYEHAALDPARRNLADVREGEYEGLEARLADPAWKPDFGPATFNARSGATAVGARGFLVAYNVNLNTTSTRRANAIAFDVRERGRPKRVGHPLTGDIELDEQGEEIWTPGSLEKVKAIGWYIDEYGIAQISMNLTDIDVTPVHVAFDEVVDKAAARGVRVTGSELVGLIPLRAMLEAGRSLPAAPATLHRRLRRRADQDRRPVSGARRADPVRAAQEDHRVRHRRPRRSSRRPVAAALRRGDRIGVSGARRRFGGGDARGVGGGAGDDGRQPLVAQARLGRPLGGVLATGRSGARLVTTSWSASSTTTPTPSTSSWAPSACRRIRTPRRRSRAEAIQAATRRAIEVPLRVMEVSVDSIDVIAAMAEEGLAASVSDAGVGALCARTAVMGAYLNVRINAGQLADEAMAAEYLKRGEELQASAIAREAEILAQVDRRL